MRVGAYGIVCYDECAFKLGLCVQYGVNRTVSGRGTVSSAVMAEWRLDVNLLDYHNAHSYSAWSVPEPLLSSVADLISYFSPY